MTLETLFAGLSHDVVYSHRAVSILTTLGVTWAFDEAASTDTTQVYTRGDRTLSVSVEPSPCPPCLWHKGAVWLLSVDGAPVQAIPGWLPLLHTLREAAASP